MPSCWCVARIPEARAFGHGLAPVTVPGASLVVLCRTGHWLGAGVRCTCSPGGWRRTRGLSRGHARVVPGAGRLPRRHRGGAVQATSRGRGRPISRTWRGGRIGRIDMGTASAGFRGRPSAAAPPECAIETPSPDSLPRSPDTRRGRPLGLRASLRRR
jgi:hypothetical protein